MAVKYNLVAKTGEYVDSKGETKARWSRVGVVLETKTGGMAIKIENIPLGWDGFANMAEPDVKEEKGEQQSKPKSTGVKAIEEMEEPIPF